MATISFAAWLSVLSRKSQRSRPGRRPQQHVARCRFVPCLETLEGRLVPSTLTVTNASDSGPGSLRAVLGAANDGDTIRFSANLNGQTIKLTTGQLNVTKSVTINGLGENNLAVSGSHLSRVFAVSAGASPSIENLTISNGMAVTG
ncbi:MAG TPA: hypothetical protein VGZ26_01590, partial [Pirellulales bacterium]|nr:hypothetical protein [Pirellulales bacterium]